VLIIAVAVWLSVRVANASGDSGRLADRYYTVKAGDTLWQIAGHFYGQQRDLRPVVFTLQQANGLRGEVLQPGVRLRLPFIP
jgi:nucleoid-associated protein YgaU